ncbi:SUZ domain-containing protein 1 [Scyliorhinus canicula]|uniref:SUZ domain-containing protein 1 n=1 Tax=Scyliorhinus canicula TaxID=7830 RepID=UPI0018F694D0|nr:SUZ domain-containing protein 1 [Scyliorhinus canicula]
MRDSAVPPAPWCRDGRLRASCRRRPAPACRGLYACALRPPGGRVSREAKMEDEEIADNWEEAADSGEIDRRLEAKLKIQQKEKKSKLPPKLPIVIQDDLHPTPCTPQIRILKRPTSNGVVSTPNSATRPPPQVKSLAQREAEYAEARKRILGSASPEEEDKTNTERPTRITQSEEIRQQSCAIRQPHGPDGTPGFKQRR